MGQDAGCGLAQGLPQAIINVLAGLCSYQSSTGEEPFRWQDSFNSLRTIGTSSLVLMGFGQRPPSVPAT